jgi:shikimate kinase
MTERVVLLGMMGSGKSEVGRILAARLGLPLFDLDAMIEGEEGTPIAGIFARGGEEEFRLIERAFVARACREPRGVLVPGGGAVIDAKSRATLRSWGTTFYLSASVSCLIARLGNEAAASRPLLAGSDPAKRLAALLEARLPYYEEADHVVDTDALDAAGVAERIASHLGPTP